MKFFLMTCLFAWLHYTSVAQKEINPNQLKYLKDDNLRNVQALLLRWQCPEVNLDSWDPAPWEQSIKVDDNSKQIIYRFRDIYPNGTDTTWWVTHYIPILLIDSITGNVADSSITFFTPRSKIDTWHLTYPSMKNEKVVMYMQLGKVRNLAGQLWANIREYQLKWKNKN